MNTTHPSTPSSPFTPRDPKPAVQADFGAVVALARLLDRIDARPGEIGAEQYRGLAAGLSQALAALPASELLQAVLSAHPSAAELYENLNYQHAGLCRASLEASLNSELAAREAIRKAAAR